MKNYIRFYGICKIIFKLREIIKEVIKFRYREIEKIWSEVDVNNSNELSKNTLFLLLKKLKLEPQITHNEVEVLWKIFILKDNKKLDFLQFIRQIGYSKKSASYENAKVAPPSHGDSDLLMLSRKLSTDR
jgi:hypothetical protein